MSNRNNDLTGKMFGYLEALYPINGEISNHNTMWMCHCHNCGKKVPVKRSHLTRTAQPHQKSCGCLIGREPKRGGANISRIKKETPDKNSKTGIRGVSADSDKNGFRTRMGFRGNTVEITGFSTIEEAAEVRKMLEDELINGGDGYKARLHAEYIKSGQLHF